jgi:hypothetical protein
LPFVIAHVSDLHVSTFGDTFHDRARIVRRSANVADTNPSLWEETWAEAGWRVLRSKVKKGKLMIVDPDGYAHPTPRRSEVDASIVDPVERAAAKACRLEARRARTLASAPPSDGALEVLSQTTPANSNVRLLRAARTVEAAKPDAVVITGDLTDDGDGYELIESAFRSFKDRKRLWVVPGNHDRYLFPLGGGSGRPRPTAESKQMAWRALADRLGLVLDPCGAWMLEVPEADAIIVGFDTCVRPQRRFFRHNGAVGTEQLAFLDRLSKTPSWTSARHRIALLHHHVVPLPHGVGKRAPSEIGMRLDDAKAVADAFNHAGVTLVMHGHRHISEERQPAGCKFRLLAAPSLTLGCRSGGGPSYWRVELSTAGVHSTRAFVPFEEIEQEDDVA